MKKLLLAIAILFASAGLTKPPAEATPSNLKEWWVEKQNENKSVNDEFGIEPVSYIEKNNNMIIAYADNYIGYSENKNRRELTNKLKIDPVETPWCAGFVNYILEKTGFKSTGSLEASSYSNYGKSVKTPIQGDIVLVKRKGGSGKHVGFFHSFTTENKIRYVVVLGGNQDLSLIHISEPTRPY